MAYSSHRLPSRFPVGTKFVIESHPGGEGQMHVYSRFLEFPDGTSLRLHQPERLPGVKSAADERRARQPRKAKKH